MGQERGTHSDEDGVDLHADLGQGNEAGSNVEQLLRDSHSGGCGGDNIGLVLEKDGGVEPEHLGVGKVGGDSPDSLHTAIITMLVPQL